MTPPACIAVTRFSLILVHFTRLESRHKITRTASDYSEAAACDQFVFCWREANDRNTCYLI